MTRAMTLFKMKKSCAVSTSLSRPASSVLSGKTESRRLGTGWMQWMTRVSYTCHTLPRHSTIPCWRSPFYPLNQRSGFLRVVRQTQSSHAKVANPNSLTGSKTPQPHASSFWDPQVRVGCRVEAKAGKLLQKEPNMFPHQRYCPFPDTPIPPYPLSLQRKQVQIFCKDHCNKKEVPDPIVKDLISDKI